MPNTAEPLTIIGLLSLPYETLVSVVHSLRGFGFGSAVEFDACRIGRDVAIGQRPPGGGMGENAVLDADVSGGTPHRAAAAAFSRSRALAPTWSARAMRSSLVDRPEK